MSPAELRAEIAEIQDRLSKGPEVNTEHMLGIDSVPMLLAFVATNTGADGVEIVARAADLSPDEVRASQAILKGLQFTEAAARLKAMAGRRTKSLVPL